MATATEHGLSTHVLDTSTGLPAAGVRVQLQARRGDAWEDRHEARTDADGRVRTLCAGSLGTGDFRLVFGTGEWFASCGIDCFFPQVTVEFRVTDPHRHHHVPLLLSPFGYSTYRGS